MPRKKLKKILSVESLPNVFKADKENVLNDIHSFFDRSAKIILEIGCGHGDFSVELARIYSRINFIGIDLKGARIYTAAKTALSLNLTNVAFLLGNASLLENIFSAQIISEIFIPFPDPHIKRKSEMRRLVSPPFLEIYKNILVTGGLIHLKTDNELIYDYSLKSFNTKNWKIIFDSEDIYSEDDRIPLNQVQTKYEQHYLLEGRRIKYICFMSM